MQPGSLSPLRAEFGATQAVIAHGRVRRGAVHLYKHKSAPSSYV